MRARNIKPSLWKDEDLAALPIATRYLFPGLWCLADCEGRLEDRPRLVKAEIFPYDENIGAAAVHLMLQQLADAGFIVRYEVAGQKYIQVTNFVKHQNPHKNEKAHGSQIPPYQSVEQVPKKSGLVPNNSGQEPKEDDPVPINSESLALIPDSLFLIPDSPLPAVPTAEEGGSKPESNTAWFDRQHESWYREYWNHTGPKDSRRAYEKAAKGIAKTERVNLTEAVELLDRRRAEYRERFEDQESWSWRSKLHPATWLNGRRWEDELPPENPRKQFARVVI